MFFVFRSTNVLRPRHTQNKNPLNSFTTDRTDELLAAAEVRQGNGVGGGKQCAAVSPLLVFRPQSKLSELFGQHISRLATCFASLKNELCARKLGF